MVILDGSMVDGLLPTYIWKINITPNKLLYRTQICLDLHMAPHSNLKN